MNKVVQLASIVNLGQKPVRVIAWADGTRWEGKICARLQVRSRFVCCSSVFQQTKRRHRFRDPRQAPRSRVRASSTVTGTRQSITRHSLSRGLLYSGTPQRRGRSGRRATRRPHRQSRHSAFIDAHGHSGYMKDLTIGPQNYTQENLIDHLQRHAYFGVALGSTWGSDFGDMPFHVRTAYFQSRRGSSRSAAASPHAGRRTPENMRVRRTCARHLMIAGAPFARMPSASSAS